MRRPTRLDWLGAGVLWSGLVGAGAVFLHLGLNVEEAVASVGGWGLWIGGLIAARVWVLRQPFQLTDATPPAGLSTGEMTAQRLADMEARIYELEERLELAERLLVEARERPRLSVVREVTPV